jgi:uncharacterized protein YbbC (DUF1343 family)
LCAGERSVDQRRQRQCPRSAAARCDRPNPLDGVTIAGPMLDPSEASFVNHHALPMRHGMTLG